VSCISVLLVERASDCSESSTSYTIRLPIVEDHAIRAEEGVMWRFEIYEDAGGAYRWRLVAANGQTSDLRVMSPLHGGLAGWDLA
jgi:hypothetical protein